MRSVRSLSGLAGPGASLKDAGGGAPGVFELIGSWIYEGDVLTAPPFDFTGIPFGRGDLLVAICVWPSGAGPGTIPGFTLFGGVASGAGRLAVHTKLADGSETTVVNDASGYQAFACAVSLGNAVDFQGTMSSLDPPAVTNAAGATVLSFAFDGTPSLATDLDVTPPSGYTLIQARENSGVTWDPSVRVAMKTNCPANENPGAWSNWTRDDRWGVATLAFEKYEGN